MKKRNEINETAPASGDVDKEANLGAAVYELLEARKAVQAAQAKVDALSKKYGSKIVAAVRKRIRF